MAPEIALDECRTLPPGSVVLDPMVGSGTTLRVASEAGCRGIGFDVDPLAVKISSVNTALIDPLEYAAAADRLVVAAKAFTKAPALPVLDEDAETRKFVEFWFAEPQRGALRRLAAAIEKLAEGPIKNALWVTFSRLIITKDRGASLARDVSHSRPHRVGSTNDFDVFAEFSRAAAKVGRILSARNVRGAVDVELGDARKLAVTDGSVDFVITSPPYLNAIDYLRGHRMALVWMGHRIGELRETRGTSIGTERGLVLEGEDPKVSRMRRAIGEVDKLKPRQQKMVDRYLADLLVLYKEQARCLRVGGQAVTVIGNCSMSGNFMRNDEACVAAAEMSGLTLVGRRERELPENRRYLPPPKAAEGSLNRRMRTETILKFEKALMPT
ncbi:DNA methyltransferase [Streptomyces sp. NRRL B-1140]|uniref:DNA methyltransferase n=1 Tax=Streptomyces sp. NRRL B-1140 TaxID=1415549 RepID=UPI00099C2639|nr:DNA methyltransferase [Streptomyces sp. NRRL B-1140]